MSEANPTPEQKAEPRRSQACSYCGRWYSERPRSCCRKGREWDLAIETARKEASPTSNPELSSPAFLRSVAHRFNSVGYVRMHRIANEIDRLLAALVVAQRYLHEREFPVDHPVRSVVDAELSGESSAVETTTQYQCRKCGSSDVMPWPTSPVKAPAPRAVCQFNEHTGGCHWIACQNPDPGSPTGCPLPWPTSAQNGTRDP